MLGKSNRHRTEKPSTASQASASPLGRKSAPSVISADMNVLGNIISEGFLDIDGRIEGNVKCQSVVVRANGRVKGDVIADNIQIYGTIEGLVKAKTVNLYSSAHVAGVIMHESLSIEDGAFVDGKFKRTDKVFIDDESADDDDEDDSSDSSSELDESVMDNLRLISG